MEFNPHYEPEYFTESILALVRLYNGENVSGIVRDIAKRRGMPKTEKLFPIFEDLDALLAKIGEAVELSGPETELLFKRRGGESGDMRELVYAVYLRQRTNMGDKIPPALAVAHVFENDFSGEDADKIRGEREFLKWLDGQGLEPGAKYDALKLCLGFPEYEAHALALIKKAEMALRENIAPFAEWMKSAVDGLLEGFAGGEPTLYGRPLPIRSGGAAPRDVFPLLFEPTSLRIYYNDLAGIQDMSVGICVRQVSELLSLESRRAERLAEFLKALADPTKLSILQKLKERDYYGGELAAALSLSGPTISHHMSALLSLGAVTVEKSGNRIYYGLDAGAVRGYLAALGEMFSLGE